MGFQLSLEDKRGLSLGELIRPFCIMLLYQYLLHYGLLLHIMSQYVCLFSLILQGVHKEGECQQLEFWAGKVANIRDLLCTTPKVLKLHGSIFWNILKILGEERTRGGAPASHKGGRRALPLLGYMVSFTLEKIIRKHSGRSTAISRRNLGRTNLGLRRSCSAGETSIREGEIIFIVITINPLIERGSISINIFSRTISSQTLFHLLYQIFVPKPRIGTCRLLVVLITPCS